jgi:hypothetical protein
MYAKATVLVGVQEVKRMHQGCLQVDEAAGLRHRRSCARHTTTGTAPATDAPTLDQDGRQHAKTIAKGVQVAHPVDPGMLETWNFSHAEPFFRCPYMDQRLDLEAVAPQPPVTPRCWRRGDVEIQYRNVLLPEHVESVAEV